MRYALLTGLFAFQSILAQTSVPISLEWNPVSGASHYRVWRGISVLATPATSKARIDVPADETSVLTVTAVNKAGESPKSRPIYVHIRPDPKLTIQFSRNLSQWSDTPDPHACFFRIKKETP